MCMHAFIKAYAEMPHTEEIMIHHTICGDSVLSPGREAPKACSHIRPH